jgi:hypothetical protein
MVVLEARALRLRYTWDRGQLLLSVQHMRGKPQDWFSLGLLRGVLLGDRGGSGVLSPEWALSFSINSGSLRRVSMTSNGAEETLAGLRTQARRRAKDLFE